MGRYTAVCPPRWANSNSVDVLRDLRIERLHGLNDQLQQALDDLAHGHHSESQRERRKQPRKHEGDEVTELRRQNSHFSDDNEAIAKIGQGLNVAGAEQRLLGWLGSLDPPSIKCLRVLTPQRSIFH